MTRKDEIKARLQLNRPTRVFSYIHGQGRIGVLLEIESDTDFALRNELVETFAHEVCLQIASMNPLSIHIDSSETDYARVAIAAETKAPKPELLERIVDGKMKKWAKKAVLLEQPWVKDNKQMVGDLLNELREKLGESTEVRRFARFGE